MKKDSVELYSFLVQLKFRTNSVCTDFEKNGLGVFFDATNKGVIIPPRRFWIRPYRENL